VATENPTWDRSTRQRVETERFEHVDAAVRGMIEDELSSKTIHNTVTLLRTMLAGKRGTSALRRGFAFHDPTMGSIFRHWNPARSRNEALGLRFNDIE
jgi:hypothetical protein